MRKTILGCAAALALCFWACGAALAGEIQYKEYIGAADAIPAASDSVLLWDGGDRELSQGNAVAFTADIPAAGRYTVSITYTAIAGATAPVEAEFRLDGAVPFQEAGSLLFYRLFTSDPTSVLRDGKGNDLTPQLIEAALPQQTYLRDSSGYVSGPLELALSQGTHSFTLTAIRGGLIISRVALEAPSEASPYGTPTGESATVSVRVQGEDAVYRNDAALTALSDRASAITEPNRGALISMNIIGGSAYSKPGSSLSWEVDVPEDGVYELRLRARQNYAHSFYAVRTLYVDGETPFLEAESFAFPYGGGFQIYVLGGDTPYLLSLSKGKHTITLTATLGSQAEALSRVQEALLSLNDVYTRILMLTGADPDPYRDYALDTKMPDTIAEMAALSQTLSEIEAELTRDSAAKGADMVAVERLIRQLNEFVEEPYEIPDQFESFKTNLSSLGEWIQDATERPLDIDYLELAIPGSPLPQAEAGFFQNLAYQAELFLDSFYTDYASFSEGEQERSITVWITGSRDRAQLLYDLIRADFTPETGISVNLQLVQSDFVTPLVSVGDGPDVLLGTTMSDPVNYASRGAAVDLTTFGDYGEVSKRFLSEAFVPFSLEGGVYALPETMSFSMMFYRTDILDSLGVSPPDTWDDLLALLPVLNRNNMQFLVDGRVGSETYGSLTALSMFLFQNGGEVYTGDGSASALDSEVAVDSFKQFTRLYTHYGMPYSFNTAARFRSGEAPIVVADYALYNTLMVSAPEISGLWAMAPVPGTERENGEISRDVRVVVTGDMILSGCKDMDAAWTFLKWCSQKETQVDYSRQLESLLGSAARYQAANLDAFESLNWLDSDLQALLSQMQYARAVPEVPGGYYTTWHVENAFRAVVISSEDARESLLDYVHVINEEITAKRQELGLATEGDE